MTSRAATAWTAAFVAVVAGVISVLRLTLSNANALSTLVWAEDGLFPLCVKAHGLLACSVDTWAGYYLLVPRLVAWPVSLVSIESWPLATNLAAAVLAALSAALVVLLLRAAGTGLVASGFVALIPVIAPIAGFEAINAVGSAYMLMAFVAALAVCFPPRNSFPVWPYAIGALTLALTIPSSVVLLMPLILQALRHRIPWRGAAISGGFLLAGLVVQGLMAATTPDRRAIEISRGTLREWVNALPDAIATFVPGQVELTPAGTLDSQLGAALGRVGIVILAIVVVTGVVMWLLPDATANSIGLMVVVGLVLGALPAVAGYVNNRYFVIPVLLWLAALIISVDRWVPWHTEAVCAVVAAAIVVVWLPGLPASSFRSTAQPEWTPMLDQARAFCAAYPDDSARLTFSPTWPFPDAPLTFPTDGRLPCADLVGKPG